MNSFFSAVDHLARIASKRELDAAELDRRRVVEQVLYVRRCLKRRVASLEKDMEEAGSAVERRLYAVCEQAVCLGGRVDAIETGVLADFERRLGLLERRSGSAEVIESLQAALQAKECELNQLRGEYLALEEAHAQLKAAVAAAKDIDELSWVQISEM